MVGNPWTPSQVELQWEEVDGLGEITRADETNSWKAKGSGPTFRSAEGNETKPDAILIPRDDIGRMKRVVVRYDMAKKLQKSKRVDWLDHAPLRLEVRYNMFFPTPPKLTQWDFDALRYAQEDLAIRIGFLEELERRMNDPEHRAKVNKYLADLNMHKAWTIHSEHRGC